MQGKTVNGYTLQRCLGRGGMAEVWLAQNRLGRQAAVKVLRATLCEDAAVTKRFQSEAQIMVKLEHRNIPRVFDYGDIDGRGCIIMEYVDGRDLKTMMKDGRRFSPDELAKWWNQLADALNYTHNVGVIHRDIKPGNIFVDAADDVKLLDFGIAKFKESIANTMTGQTIGTLMYMSPEQVRDSKSVDHRTDYYSLAVTFVHLITGVPPYDSDSSGDLEIRNSIASKPLDFSAMPKEFKQWKKFLKKYLEKDPAKRPLLEHIVLKKTELKTFGDDSDSDETMIGTGRPSTAVTPGTGQPRYCRKCGSLLSPQALFCKKCGKKVR